MKALILLCMLLSVAGGNAKRDTAFDAGQTPYCSRADNAALCADFSDKRSNDLFCDFVFQRAYSFQIHGGHPSCIYKFRARVRLDDELSRGDMVWRAV